MFKMLPQALATSEVLYDEYLPLDPDLDQDFCLSVFDDYCLSGLYEPEDVPFLAPGLRKRKREVEVKNIKLRKKRSKKESYKHHWEKQRCNRKWKPTEDRVANTRDSLPMDAKTQTSLTSVAKTWASLPTDVITQASLTSDTKVQASLTQCLGPSCVQPAQLGSKYCSTDCGMKLAANRIFKILPQQLQQWQQSPGVADQQGRKLLEQIAREQEATRRHLRDLEGRSQELEALILRAKQQVVGEDQETEEGDKKHQSHQLSCVSCGHPTSLKGALRHMELCYAKYERQTCLGSKYPMETGGAMPLFCNVYDPKSKLYCNQLRVLCPEHSRDPKEPADEVCGCPLARDVFELTGAFCPLPKSRCRWHYAWEKLQRAELDLERVRAWTKLEGLLEQEQMVRQASASRGSLLALMLHRTIQHDPLTSDLRTHTHH